jgi:3'-phosphoadenosine 5'-phosphosulfate (PAPS) 3'-phosphatase
MWEEILNVLTSAVTLGGAQKLDVRRHRTVDAEYKTTKELVTTADKKSDAAILSVFLARLPGIDPAISFELEESGPFGRASNKRVGADPLDGTNHFAAGGNLYSVQAHYLEEGLPLVGVVFQPEAYLPLEETNQCVGRIAFAIHGQETYMRRSLYKDPGFEFGDARPLTKQHLVKTQSYVACVPLSTKMSFRERECAVRV